MKKLITISLISMLFFGCSEEPKEKDELLNKIEELQKSNDVLQQKNDSLSTLISLPNVEIIDVKEESRETSTTNLNMSGSNSQNPSQGQVLKEGETVTIRIEEELTDNKPDESVSNPFARNNGGFDGSFNGQGSKGGSSAPGNGDGPSGQGFGGPQRENNPTPPNYDTDYGGNVCVELLINDQGKAISAKSCNSTSHPDQNVIKSVVEFVKKNVKYKAEEGAPNRKAFYTVYIKAG